MASQRTYDIPLGRLFSVAPGIPTTDMARTVEHYQRLGFTFSVPGSAAPPAEAGFAIGERDGVALHFAVKPDHDPSRTAIWVYISVEDADELSAEFDASGAGQGRTPRDTDYKMRELAHIDPDGNMLLFGSPLPQDPEDPAEGPAGEPTAGQDPGAAHDPRVFEFTTALRRGEVARLRALLAADPGVARSLINSCTPLHLFADAPGHRPNPAGVVSALVEAGADLDAHSVGTWHYETPLHWAASNDDVGLIDALLDAGADIEHPGSSISGGPPAESALGYTQWQALRRLYERGATMNLSRAAALGLMPLVTELATATPPDSEELTMAFWNACRAGQLEAARYLAGRGADINWRAPWSGETPLDAARGKHERAVVAWLTESGATSGSGPAAS
jgi:predicted enzyme related to lactoylglutathione lyase